MSENTPKRRGRPPKAGAYQDALAPLKSKMRRTEFAGRVGALSVDALANKIPWRPECRKTFAAGLTDPETVTRLAIHAAIEHARAVNRESRREAIGRAMVARRGGDDLSGLGEPFEGDHLALPERLELALAAPEEPLSHSTIFEAKLVAARLGVEASPEALRTAAVGQAGRTSDAEGAAFIMSLAAWWTTVTGERATYRIANRSERQDVGEMRALTFADLAQVAWKDATGGFLSARQLRVRAGK